MVQSSQWGRLVPVFLADQYLQLVLGYLADLSTLLDQLGPVCPVVRLDLVVRCLQLAQSNLLAQLHPSVLSGRLGQYLQLDQLVRYLQLGPPVQLGRWVLVFLVSLGVQSNQWGQWVRYLLLHLLDRLVLVVRCLQWVRLLQLGLVVQLSLLGRLDLVDQYHQLALMAQLGRLVLCFLLAQAPWTLVQ